MSQVVTPEKISAALSGALNKIEEHNQKQDKKLADRIMRFRVMWIFTSVVMLMVAVFNFHLRAELSNWDAFQVEFAKPYEVLGPHGSAQYAEDHRELLAELRKLRTFMGTLGYSVAWDAELSPNQKVSFLFSAVDVGIRRLENVEGKNPESASAYRAFRQVLSRLSQVTTDASLSYSYLRMTDRYGKETAEKTRIAWWIRFLPLMIPFFYGLCVFLAEEEE